MGVAIITNGVSQSTAQIIANLFSVINPYSVKEVAGFAKQAGQIIIGSQRTVANAHIAAQLIQLRAMGINQTVPVVIPDEVRGSTVTFGGGRPKVSSPKDASVDYDDGKQNIPKTDASPGKVFERAAETYRYERSTGKDHDAATELADQRIDRIVDNNLILSARMAAQQTLVRVAAKDERITGYRRIIHPELSKGGVCGLCVAAADQVYKVGTLMEIHDRCKCSIAAVTTAQDPGHSLNREDLDKLYEHAGGSTAGKSLKRTRYTVVHHHELGPVLTRASGEQIPYYSTTPQAA